MEPATLARSPLARARAARFERECERLRPLGEAYVLRRFGSALNRADAEDAVAEVLVRLHRMAEAGTPPRNLRAAFFTSVRNQAIDQIRSRAVRPTVELEAAGEAEAPDPAPSEWAEGREDAARLQEALGRMRGNYREAIMLRFGLGLTVPEIAEHRGISLAAAKKLVLRATAQARERMQALEASEHCPQMRELARHAVLEKQVSGVGEERELALLRAHISHCGPCKSFVATLHGHLHDLGGAAVFGLFGAERLPAAPGVLDGFAHWGAGALEAVQSAGERVRHVAYKAAGALPGSDAGPAGAVLSTGQKVAAICTAGAATTATCLLTGAVGPGIATPAEAPVEPERPAAHVREHKAPEPAAAPEPAPAPVEETQPEPTATPQPEATPAPATAPSQAVAVPESSPSPAPEPSEPPPSDFGVEGAASPSSTESSAARSTNGAEAESEAPAAHSGGSAGSGSGVGFHG